MVVGRIYPESVNIAEDLFLERVIGFLLVNSLPLLLFTANNEDGYLYHSVVTM